MSAQLQNEFANIAVEYDDEAVLAGGGLNFPAVAHNVIPYYIYPDQAAMYAHPPEVPVIGPEGSSSSPANGTANPKETPMSAPLLPTSMPYSFSAPFRYYQPVYEGTGGYIYGR